VGSLDQLIAPDADRGQKHEDGARLEVAGGINGAGPLLPRSISSERMRVVITMLQSGIAFSIQLGFNPTNDGARF
jgi:hypothetical protein